MKKRVGLFKKHQAETVGNWSSQVQTAEVANTKGQNHKKTPYNPGKRVE